MSVSEFLALLAVPPGSLAYHLIRLVVLEAGVALAWFHHRIGRDHRDRLAAWGLASALALQVVPLALATLHVAESAWALGALEFLIALAIVWALALIHLAQRWVVRIAPALVGVCVLGALALWPLNSEMTSRGVTSVLFLLGAGTLFSRREQGNWRLLVLAFLLLSASPLAPLLTLGSMPAAGAGRLVGLAGYLVLLVALYQQTAAQWLGERVMRSSLEGELQSLSRGALRQSQQHLSLLQVGQAAGTSLGLRAVLQMAAESLSVGGQADRVVIALSDEREPDRFWVLAGYDSVERQVWKLSHERFSLRDFPRVQRAVVRRRVIVLDRSADDKELIGLHALMRTKITGPLLVQPLVYQERLLGLVLLSKSSSSRPFGEDNFQFYAALSDQIACAIANARLHQSVARLQDERHADAKQRQAILERIHDGVVATDPQGQIVLANSAAGRMLAMETDELPGRTLRELCPSLWINGGLNPNSFELHGRVILGTMTPVGEKDGELLGFVVVLHDITQETQTRPTENELIAAISRELRTPLTVIKRCTDLLVAGLGGDLNNSHREFVEIIRNNTNRMVGVTDNLITLSELEAGVLYSPAVIDIAPIVREAINTIRPQLLKRRLSIGNRLPDHIPPVIGDPRLLRQVLDNLLSNACKFTPLGGYVEVNATVVPSGVVGHRDLGYLVVDVSDTGVGIPAAELSKIFTRFYRAENPLSIEAGGAGIGLTVAKDLVDLHGGRIWVDSEVGKGSAFTCMIPLARWDREPG